MEILEEIPVFLLDELFPHFCIHTKQMYFPALLNREILSSQSKLLSGYFSLPEEVICCIFKPW